MITQASRIKRVSADRLAELMEAAAADPKATALGRPAWLAEHRRSVRTVMLTLLEKDTSVRYRCLVVAALDRGPTRSFFLDVSANTFRRLRNLPSSDVNALALRYLRSVEPMDLEPAQKKDSDQLKTHRQALRKLAGT